MVDKKDEGTVRRFRIDDTEDINRILRDAFPWTKYETTFSIDSSEVAGTGRCFVFDTGNQVTGFVWALPDAVFGQSGYIRLVGIDESYRESGIGAVLMDRAEAYLSDRGRDVFLLVSAFNANARGFYEHRGYERIGTIEGYVEKVIDEVLLRKQLLK